MNTIVYDFPQVYLISTKVSVRLWRHHDLLCLPGLWAVYCNAFDLQYNAVVDDFGNLVWVS